MKKGPLILLIVAIILVLWGVMTYNSLVAGRAGVEGAWANVEVQYQRRSDLVPQLVATVEGAASFERKTLTDVVEARAKATQINADITDAASLEAFTAAQSQLSGALSRLLVTVEAYPTITSTQGFRDLQSQLEGTENRIAVARGDFNTAATSWNARVSTFPRVMLAKLFGFDRVALFDAAPGSDTAPTVEFDIQ